MSVGTMARSTTPRSRRPEERDRLPVHIVGKRINAELHKRGETLSWLAERSNMSLAALSLLTRGLTKQPMASTLESIAIALGLSVSELLGLPAPDLAGGSAIVRVPIVDFGRKLGCRGGLATGAVMIVVGAQETDRRLLGAAITAVGSTPVGDVAVFDPDAACEHGQTVLLSRRGFELTAWYCVRENGAGPCYLLGEGLELEITEATYRGVVVGFSRTPPLMPA